MRCAARPWHILIFPRKRGGNHLPGAVFIYQVDVRPLIGRDKAEYDSKKIRLHLDRPVKLSIEVNRERFHNLHLIAGRIREDRPEPESGNTIFLPGDLKKVSVHRTEDLVRQLERMPEGRCVYFGPGLHYLEECAMRIPSDTEVYLEAEPFWWEPLSSVTGKISASMAGGVCTWPISSVSGAERHPYQSWKECEDRGNSFDQSAALQRVHRRLGKNRD